VSGDDRKFTPEELVESARQLRTMCLVRQPGSWKRCEFAVAHDGLHDWEIPRGRRRKKVRQSSGPFVSDHAAHRFRERFVPTLTFGRAKRELILLSQTAQRLKHRTNTGHELWEAGEVSKVWLVIKHERGSSILVTVLYPIEGDEPLVLDEDQLT
jgi:hypothetical protein